MAKPITAWEMTVIINIQGMNKRIDPKYDGSIDFKRLRKLNLDELHAEQELLIPKYNNKIDSVVKEINFRQYE
jgi:hypothetical protein